MTQLSYGICGISITTGTGVGGKAVCSTGRCGDYSGVLMALSLNGLSLKVIATATISALLAIYGAGRVCRNHPGTHIVTQLSYGICSVSITTGTGVGGVAVCSTGRCGDYSGVAAGMLGFACQPSLHCFQIVKNPGLCASLTNIIQGQQQIAPPVCQVHANGGIVIVAPDALVILRQTIDVDIAAIKAGVLDVTAVGQVRHIGCIGDALAYAGNAATPEITFLGQVDADLLDPGIRIVIQIYTILVDQFGTIVGPDIIHQEVHAIVGMLRIRGDDVGNFGAAAGTDTVIEVVAQFRDLLLLCSAADRTGNRLEALLGAGGFLRHNTFIPLVTGRDHNGLFLTAELADTGSNTILGAGSFLGDGFIPIVTGFDYEDDRFTAGITGMCHSALSGAGRFLGHNAVIPAVAGLLLVIIPVGMAAGAGVLSIAPSSAGRRYDFFSIAVLMIFGDRKAAVVADIVITEVVSGGRQDLFLICAAAAAGIQVIAVLCAGGLCCGGVLVVVTQRRCIVADIAVAAGTSVSSVAILGTGRCGDYSRIDAFAYAVRHPGDGAAVVLPHIFRPGWIIGRVIGSGFHAAKHIIIAKAGCISLESDFFQFNSIPECRISNISNRPRNMHTWQAHTALKCCFANAGNGIRNFISSGFASRASNQQRLILVKQNTILITAIVGILLIYLDFGQTGAVSEGIVVYARYGCRNLYAFQGFAIIERIRCYASHRIGDCNTGQAGATIEGTPANVGHRIRNHHIGQAGTAIKRTGYQFGDRIRNLHTGQAGTVFECMIANIANRIGDLHTWQAGTSIKCGISHGGNRIRDFYPCHVTTIIECTTANAGSTGFYNCRFDRFTIVIPGRIITSGVIRVAIHLAGAGDGQGTILGQNPGQVIAADTAGNDGRAGGISHPGDAAAVILPHILRPGLIGIIICRGSHVIECIIANRRRRTIKGYLFQDGAVIKRILTNTGYTVRDGHRGQAHTEIERLQSNAFYTVSNRHRGQTSATLECTITNTNHSVWDGHRGQVITERGRTITNGDHAVRDHITAGDTTRYLNQCGLIPIKQNTVLVTAEIWITGAYPNTGQVRAAAERILTDAFYTVSNRHRSQVITGKECFRTNADRTVRDGHRGQTRAVVECRNANAGNRVGDFHAGNISAIRKRIAANAGSTGFYNHRFDRFTIVIPGRIITSGDIVVIHLARTGDGQGSILRQHPGQVITADTRGNDGIRRSPGDFTAVILADLFCPGCIIGRIISCCSYAVESMVTKAGSISRKCNSLQVIAVAKSITSNNADRSRNLHTSQAVTVKEHTVAYGWDGAAKDHAAQAPALIEHRITDTVHVVTDLHAGQSLTICKRRLADALDRGWHSIFTGSSSGAGNQGSLVLIEQDSIVIAAVFGICAINLYFRQAGATMEGRIANPGYRFGNGHAGQAGAQSKSIKADTGNRIRDIYTLQTGAISKCILINESNRIGDFHAGHISAIRKRIWSYTGCSVFNNHTVDHIPVVMPRHLQCRAKVCHFTCARNSEDTILRQHPGEVRATSAAGDHRNDRYPSDLAAIILPDRFCPRVIDARIIRFCGYAGKHLIAKAGCIALKGNFTQSGATTKYSPTKVCNGIRNRHTGQIATVKERRSANICDRIGDRYLFQVTAVTEYASANLGNRIANLYCRQAGAMFKCIVANRFDRVRNRYTGQAGTIIECSVTDLFDGIGDRYTG